MPPKKEETQEEYFERLRNGAHSLTQNQIDACAWAMGGSGVGWTKETILRSLEGFPLDDPNRY